MATDDEAPPKPAEARAPEGDSKPEPRNEINEKLAERIRQGTTPPMQGTEDKLTETIRQRLEHLVPELVKKTFTAGMGAVFSTEEGIRRIAREVVATKSLDGHDRAAGQQAPSLTDRCGASDVRLTRLTQCQRWATIRARDRLSVESAVCRVGVFRRAGRAQRQRGHGGRRPVVR